MTDKEDRVNKIYGILIGIVILAILGLLVYLFLFFKNPEENNIDDNNTNDTTNVVVLERTSFDTLCDETCNKTLGKIVLGNKTITLGATTEMIENISKTRISFDEKVINIPNDPEFDTIGKIKALEIYRGNYLFVYVLYNTDKENLYNYTIFMYNNNGTLYGSISGKTCDSKLSEIKTQDDYLIYDILPNFDETHSLYNKYQQLYNNTFTEDNIKPIVKARIKITEAMKSGEKVIEDILEVYNSCIE